jgi:hypothetical protein
MRWQNSCSDSFAPVVNEIKTDTNRNYAVECSQGAAETSGVIEVISELQRQRLLECLRRKAELDELSRLSRLSEAREQGRAEGLRCVQRIQILIGRIMMLQELLGIQPTPAKELIEYDEAHLNELADQMLNQYRSRGE